MSNASRRFPIGAEPVADGVNFRVWAPRHRAVSVIGETKGEAFEASLVAEAEGYFSGTIPSAGAGSTYQFRLGAESRLFPDPASRFQPEGPHGPSMVIDPAAFPWTDHDWKGLTRRGTVLYELHLGTFTAAGTWAAAIERLPHLADTGITAIEVMPVADFVGTFGWGYDGVNLFAPTRLYGEPDDFRRFVDRAHALGMGVILDVVYNHFGPDGNYIAQFSDSYFTDRYSTDWGSAINFDGDHSAPVREFVRTNAAYWIEEFHLDGLRLDATQCIYDSSPTHILEEVTTTARRAAGNRSIFVVAENETQHVHHVLSPEEGGFGMDAVWNDDLHHSLHVSLTGRSEAYYTDYRGTPQEFISALKWGYLYQGQWYRWQKQRRGTPALGVDPASFVSFLENHDQIANSGTGQRMIELAAPARYRALTALVLLAPSTPMLFQGQEFGSRTEFHYFADHSPELSRLVDEGRRKFLSQFPSLASPAMQERIRNPGERATFEHSKLDWSDLEKNREQHALVRDLLHLRRNDPVIAAQTVSLEGAVLSDDAFVIRLFDESGDDRLLLVNLGGDLKLSPAPEPLLAPPLDGEWRLLFSSEEPKYGGPGTPPTVVDGEWFLPGPSALLFTASPLREEPSC